MFELGVVSEFEAALELKGDFGPANHLHGHTYRVEVSLRGKELKESGILCDIATLKEDLKRVLDTLNYKYLNDLEPFKATNPTVEKVSKHIFDSLAPGLRESAVSWLRVTVWESSSAYAAYQQDLL